MEDKRRLPAGLKKKRKRKSQGESDYQNKHDHSWGIYKDRINSRTLMSTAFLLPASSFHLDYEHPLLLRRLGPAASAEKLEFLYCID